ncbi:MAG: DUF3473 domain-containing protein, partial [Desulfovermiculus sp.]
AGYYYDSSYNSYASHGRYGHLDDLVQLPGSIVHKDQHDMYELPVSNLCWGKKVMPWSGGGYFRLMPFAVFWTGVKKILKDQGSYLFYMHPWEIDPDQPRIVDLPWSYRFRHYVNLASTYNKLSKLMLNLQDHRFLTCYEYIREVELDLRV